MSNLPHAPESPAAGKPYSSQHIPELDGIRGLAVLLVIIAHSGLTHERVDLGRSGVVLFFVLSGFLISGILMDQRDTPGYFKNFWGRRVLRIFPLYTALMVILFLILPHIIPAKMSAFHSEVSMQGWYWTYMQNYRFCLWGFPDFNVLSHLWSLAVEEQFYLFWPFVVLWIPAKHLKWACWFCIVVGFGSRIVQYSLGMNWVWSYTSLWSSFDSLALGALMAIGVRQGTLQRYRPRYVIGLIAGLVLVGGIILLQPTLGPPERLRHAVLLIERSACTLIAACMILLVIILPAQSGYRRVFRGKFLKICGKYSYAMYVFHPFILLVLDRLISRYWSTFGDLPVILRVAIQFPIVLALTVAISLVSWFVLEKPALKLKRYFAYDKSSNSSSS